jgi:hypothetical protein
LAMWTCGRHRLSPSRRGLEEQDLPRDCDRFYASGFGAFL